MKNEKNEKKKYTLKHLMGLRRRLNQYRKTIKTCKGHFTSYCNVCRTVPTVGCDDCILSGVQSEYRACMTARRYQISQITKYNKNDRLTSVEWCLVEARYDEIREYIKPQLSKLLFWIFG